MSLRLDFSQYASGEVFTFKAGRKPEKENRQMAARKRVKLKIILISTRPFADVAECEPDRTANGRMATRRTKS